MVPKVALWKGTYTYTYSSTYTYSTKVGTRVPVVLHSHTSLGLAYVRISGVVVHGCFSVCRLFVRTRIQRTHVRIRAPCVRIRKHVPTRTYTYTYAQWTCILLLFLSRRRRLTGCFLSLLLHALQQRHDVDIVHGLDVHIKVGACKHGCQVSSAHRRRCSASLKWC
jgi:hypothetical protein